MKITWNEDNTVATDENGNTATVKRWGSGEAAVASLESNRGCVNCHDCHDCHGCLGCTNCVDCRRCFYCISCDGLSLVWRALGAREDSVPDAGPEPDPVNHPTHYTQHPSGIEVIEITEHMGFCLGNAIKYILRAEHKGNLEQDLRKAIWYIEREIARRGKQ